MAVRFWLISLANSFLKPAGKIYTHYKEIIRFLIHI